METFLPSKNIQSQLQLNKYSVFFKKKKIKKFTFS